MKRAVTAGLALVSMAFGGIAWSRRPSNTKPGSVVKTQVFRGTRFDVVELPLEAWDVRVGWRPGGTRLRDVDGVVRTNAGIFEPDFTPTGLLVSGGTTLHPLELREGLGNFYLRPNGVFLLGANGPQVVQSSEYDGSGVREATQSGPLLLRRGVIHPSLKEDSGNRLLRSAVGVKGNTVVLIISRDDVNLWTTAALFRDVLGCDDALYLDGVISALWAADAGRDADLDKGPFTGVITASPKL